MPSGSVMDSQSAPLGRAESSFYLLTFMLGTRCLCPEPFSPTEVTETQSSFLFVTFVNVFFFLYFLFAQYIRGSNVWFWWWWWRWWFYRDWTEPALCVGEQLSVLVLLKFWPLDFQLKPTQSACFSSGQQSVNMDEAEKLHILYDPLPVNCPQTI